MRFRSLIVPTLFTVAAALSPVYAGPLAVTFNTAPGEQLGNGPFTLGYQFTVNSPILVTALDAFDSNGQPLVDSHDVGIWDSTGTLLVSATVDAGTLDPLNGEFRSVAVSPTQLLPGVYNIGAVWQNLGDPLIFPGDLAGVTTIPQIVFNQNEYIAGGSLTDPTNTTGDAASYFGADFEASPVPEPASMLLFGTAALGVGVLVRRRRASAQQ